MTQSVQHRDLRTGAGACAATLLVGGVVVVAGQNRQAWPCGGALEIAAQPGHGRLDRGPLEAGEAVAHGCVLALSDGERNVFVHAAIHQCGSTFGDRQVDQLRYRILAGSRGRPHLYAIVPLIVLVEEADDVAYPTAHQFGPCHHDVHYVGSAPVVTHQVDRPLEALYSVTSQRRYSSTVAVNRAGTGAPKPGGDRRTTGPRSRSGANLFQTAAVSGLPWTRHTVTRFSFASNSNIGGGRQDRH